MRAETTRIAGAGARRAVLLAVACCVLTSISTVSATAGPTGQLKTQKHHLSQIQKHLRQRRDTLTKLDRELATIAHQISATQDRLVQTEHQIAHVKASLAKTQAHYEVLRTEMNHQIRETYIRGPSGGITLVLNATSWQSLVDGMNYMDHLTLVDANLAQELETVAAQLTQKQQELTALKAKRVEMLHELAAQQKQLRAKFARQRRLIAYLQKQKNTVENQISLLQPFEFCPVKGPHAYSDDFGAIRHTTTPPHLHQGNDILAPMGTPIVAPFDGIARAGHDTLGGLSVKVYGKYGYVYNAHLSKTGQLGQVKAGTVVGYVGNSGDAAGGPTHDHFEWHPKNIPSSLHVSPYHQKLINGAIDPFPYLNQVC